jgi:hypothetical protein
MSLAGPISGNRGGLRVAPSILYGLVALVEAGLIAEMIDPGLDVASRIIGAAADLSCAA